MPSSFTYPEVRSNVADVVFDEPEPAPESLVSMQSYLFSETDLRSTSVKEGKRKSSNGYSSCRSKIKEDDRHTSHRRRTGRRHLLAELHDRLRITNNSHRTTPLSPLMSRPSRNRRRLTSTARPVFELCIPSPQPRSES